MFTGIVQTKLPVTRVERQTDFATLILTFPPGIAGRFTDRCVGGD